AGFYRLEHVRVRDRSRVAFALQQEFRMVDAARDIRRQDQQEIDLLRGKCGQLERKQRCQRQHAANEFASPALHHLSSITSPWPRSCNAVTACRIADPVALCMTQVMRPWNPTHLTRLYPRRGLRPQAQA